MEGSINPMVAWLRIRLACERGASLVEYGLLLILIAVAALVAVQAFGQGVSTQFSTITSAVG
ncbi:MAG: Flp family type IVb pilin [Actinobacteria bacterium]|nr:Flp family type IVb pilin [Actinomycetota bacterium]